MSLVKKSKQTCRAVTRALARIFKLLVRLLTRKSELERLIRKSIAEESRGHPGHLVKNIARSLAASSQLAEIKATIFGNQPFLVAELTTQITNKKHIHNDDVISRLSWCLKVLSTTNEVHKRVGELQRTSYDPANPEHVAQLESLWESLRPGCRREDWGELGFQNSKVPQSDFRGMGMLGLHQLIFFAEHRTREAQDILTASTNPKRYFPFAAAGINITAFTTTMLEQRRLESRIYDALVKRMPSPPEGNSWPNEETLVSAGVAAFNDFYGEEYVQFSRFWHESLPESTMAFPGIFGTIKQRSNSKFPPLVEED